HDHRMLGFEIGAQLGRGPPGRLGELFVFGHGDLILAHGEFFADLHGMPRALIRLRGAGGRAHLEFAGRDPHHHRSAAAGLERILEFLGLRGRRRRGSDGRRRRRRRGRRGRGGRGLFLHRGRGGRRGGGFRPFVMLSGGDMRRGFAAARGEVIGGAAGHDEHPRNGGGDGRPVAFRFFFDGWWRWRGLAFWHDRRRGAGRGVFGDGEVLFFLLRQRTRRRGGPGGGGWRGGGGRGGGGDRHLLLLCNDVDDHDGGVVLAGDLRLLDAVEQRLDAFLGGFGAVAVMQDLGFGKGVKAVGGNNDAIAAPEFEGFGGTVNFGDVLARQRAHQHVARETRLGLHRRAGGLHAIEETAVAVIGVFLD